LRTEKEGAPRELARALFEQQRGVPPLPHAFD
jgi:hypothetical protein